VEIRAFYLFFERRKGMEEKWCEGLSSDEWEEKYDSTEKMRFLHGRCDQWLNSNFQEGDKCIAITEYRNELDGLGLLHCCLLRNGKYKDVRGETENFQDVLDTFDYGEYNIETYDCLKDFNNRLFSLEKSFKFRINNKN
jgi:hypothetical protein